MLTYLIFCFTLILYKIINIFSSPFNIPKIKYISLVKLRFDRISKV